MLFLTVFHAQAEPADVLIGDLTFVRPETWRWQPPPQKTRAQSSFLVPCPSTNTPATVVLFNEGERDTETVIKGWKNRFPDAANRLEGEVVEKNINKRVVTCYEASGTYVFAGQRKENYTFIGAVIPSGARFVCVSLMGPTARVREAEGIFKAMIENAVKAAE